ncbi:MAG: Bcr/CflA family drug resistance efflux transporter, partial [Acetobacteraceae bacterium]|nr:Bcr/CflA family drug resistance efflux transporter [Acetobacteraceae bacterium]
MSPRDASEGAVAAAPVRPKPSLFLLVAMTGLGPFTMQIVIP